MKLKTLAVSLLLGLAVSPALAADQYLVRVPAKIDLSPAISGTEISISLLDSVLPDGTVGRPFGELQDGFDLTPLLDVNPSSYNLNDISWRITEGALPDGLSLDSSGKIIGSPLSVSWPYSSFELQASYKGRLAQRTYHLRVSEEPPSYSDTLLSIDTSSQAANQAINGIKNNGSRFAFSRHGNPVLQEAEGAKEKVALYLNGASYLSTNEITLSGHDDWSVSFSIRPLTTPVASSIIASQWIHAGSDRWSISMTPQNKIGFQWARDSLYKNLVVSQSAIPNNTWSQVKYVKKGNLHQIYINGKLDASATHGYIGFSSETPVSIGALATGEYFLNGYIDKLEIKAEIKP